MKLVPIQQFISETMGGAPVRADMSIYQGKEFQCACGKHHQFSGLQDDVIRELFGMKFVFRCPERNGVTLVKIKGLFSTKIESLVGTKDGGDE